VDFFNEDGIIFQSLKKIIPRELSTRKKIDIYLGVDIKGYFVDIMQLEKKSRILLKEAKEIELLHKKLELYNGSLIKKRYIIVKAPLCSKAKSYLESEGWKVW
jgi:alkyl hydroperoxide reductase subunit AhpF